ncbi:hypothetical protein DICPUDRAFT_73467, partial [Dictyostelium purpureum]
MKYTILFLFVLYFSFVNSNEYYSNVYYSPLNHSLVFYMNEIVNINISSQPRGTNFGNAKMNQSVFINEDYYSFNISNLVLPYDTSKPYRISTVDAVGLGYVNYFNFGELRFCTYQLNRRADVYQGCIIGNISASNSQSGGLDTIKYEVGDRNVFKINYKATELAYGCIRNTWYILKCNPDIHMHIQRMDVKACDYTVYIESKYACASNTLLSYYYVDNKLFLPLTGFGYEAIELYFNNTPIVLDLKTLPV